MTECGDTYSRLGPVDNALGIKKQEWQTVYGRVWQKGLKGGNMWWCSCESSYSIVGPCWIHQMERKEDLGSRQRTDVLFSFAVVTWTLFLIASKSQVQLFLFSFFCFRSPYIVAAPKFYLLTNQVVIFQCEDLLIRLLRRLTSWVSLLTVNEQICCLVANGTISLHNLWKDNVVSSVLPLLLGSSSFHRAATGLILNRHAFTEA